jgi:hypothetical protein
LSVAVSGTITCSSRAVSGWDGSTSRTTPDEDTSVRARRLTTPGFAPGTVGTVDDGGEACEALVDAFDGCGVMPFVAVGAVDCDDVGGAVPGVTELSTKLRDGRVVD